MGWELADLLGLVEVRFSFGRPGVVAAEPSAWIFDAHPRGRGLKRLLRLPIPAVRKPTPSEAPVQRDAHNPLTNETIVPTLRNSECGLSLKRGYSQFPKKKDVLF